MINYDAGELIDLLPANMKYDPDVRAISYALKRGKDKLLQYCERIKLLSNIDSLPEELLDLIALELNSHYYDQTLSLEQKRNIVRATLGWYMQAGTVAVVEEMMQIIFGNGGTVEWYDFEDGPGKPGTFDIYTDATLTPDLMERMTEILKRVKKASAHLRRLDIRRNYHDSIEFGAVVISRIQNEFFSASEEVRDNHMELQILMHMSCRIENVMKGEAG